MPEGFNAVARGEHWTLGRCCCYFCRSCNEWRPALRAAVWLRCLDVWWDPLKGFEKRMMSHLCFCFDHALAVLCEVVELVCL